MFERVRLFSSPKKSPYERSPFYNRTLQQISDFKVGAFDSVKELRLLRESAGKDLDAKLESSREISLFNNAWGQRVSQLVVASGKICASTGSMGGSKYIEEISPPKQLYEQYGRVYCALLPRHMLYEVNSTEEAKISISVTSE